MKKTFLKTINYIILNNLLYGESKQKSSEKDHINIIFPYLNEYKVENNRKKNEKNIFGTFVNVNLENHDFCLKRIINQDENEKFLKIMDRTTLKKETIECIVFFKKENNEKQTITSYRYTIDQIPPYYNSKDRKERNLPPNLLVSFNKKKEENFILSLTKKERNILKDLYFNHRGLQSMWFIYSNFEELYEKEFFIFKTNGSIMKKKEAKNFFKRLVKTYAYQVLYQSM